MGEVVIGHNFTSVGFVASHLACELVNVLLELLPAQQYESEWQRRHINIKMGLSMLGTHYIVNLYLAKLNKHAPSHQKCYTCKHATAYSPVRSEHQVSVHKPRSYDQSDQLQQATNNWELVNTVNNA